jgi:hypothetical protein
VKSAARAATRSRRARPSPSCISKSATLPPFFTGRQKLIDTEGRVERFTKRFGAQTAEARKQATKAVKAAKASKTTKKQANA